ncbi:hypothetical protein KC887_04260 [Candidatus Kaiserbacteria bacterium]|nr:hypothetical protein [Candidatus Kaiserbacteria bacterium]
METFFLYLKRGLVATMFVIFGFVATYIPHPLNHVDEAYAGGIGGVNRATETTQIMNNVELAGINVTSLATSVSTGSLWLKENVLDGIGWFIAKQIVSSMVQSIINWINSGFQGSPAFVTDLKGFLLNVADQAIGQYISDLGGIGSFICSPFRLDAQISVSMSYAQARANGGDGQPAPTCTLTGIINNIQSFIGGNFSSGGWDDWIDITTQPETYTPFGAVMSAEIGAHAKLINAQGEEVKLLDFGDGFLSQKVCQSVSGFTGSQNCSIVKPGKVISEQLNKALGAGQDALITADEINEVIAALLGQLAKTVMTGAAGLLGLSSGTGYTYSGYQGGSYLTQMGIQAASSTLAASSSANIIINALSVQQQYLTLAQTYLPQLNNYTSTSSTNMSLAQQAAAQAQNVINVAGGPNGTVVQLQNILNQYNSAGGNVTAQQTAISAYTNLQSQLFTQNQYNQSATNWPQVLQLP